MTLAGETTDPPAARRGPGRLPGARTYVQPALRWDEAAALEHELAAFVKACPAWLAGGRITRATMERRIEDMKARIRAERERKAT